MIERIPSRARKNVMPSQMKTARLNQKAIRSADSGALRCSFRAIRQSATPMMTMIPKKFRNR